MQKDFQVLKKQLGKLQVTRKKKKKQNHGFWEALTEISHWL